MRVLIVEDDDAIATPLAKGLEREGLDVDRVETGEAALGRASETAFDVVLLDLGLPDCDGFDVCRELRGGRMSPSSSSPPARRRSTGSSVSSWVPTTTS